jgi:hypothetical protein
MFNVKINAFCGAKIAQTKKRLARSSPYKHTALYVFNKFKIDFRTKK